MGKVTLKIIIMKQIVELIEDNNLLLMKEVLEKEIIHSAVQSQEQIQNQNYILIGVEVPIK